MKTSESPFMSALAGGTYQSPNGGALSAGQPCWTIWGMPCFRPRFGVADEDNATGASFGSLGE